MRTILRRARSLLRLRLLLMQLGLAILVTGLFVLWLRVPESNVAEVAVSFLLAVVIAAIALGGESFLLLQTCPISYSDVCKRMQIGALAFLFSALLWFGWSALLDRWSINDSLLAGYLNSRAPAHLRSLLSFNRLYDWLEDGWAMLHWFATGFLLAASLALLLAQRRARAVLGLTLSPAYWIVFTVTAVAGSQLTSALIKWTPGHGLGVEFLSLILRLGVVVLLDLVLTCFLFTTATAIVLRSDERAGTEVTHSVPNGNPAPSQLRT